MGVLAVPVFVNGDLIVKTINKRVCMSGEPAATGIFELKIIILQDFIGLLAKLRSLLVGCLS
ncbi:hypothetical protein D3C86_1948690 [compost metagenome]